jgi:hypothetical protein
VAAEFVEWVDCRAIAVVAGHMMVELIGHRAVLDTRSLVHNQQDYMPLLKVELVAWRVLLGSWTHVLDRGRRTQQMFVDFEEYNQWMLSSNRQVQAVFLVRLFFRPTLLWLRLQHEKKTLLVQRPVVLLWVKLVHWLSMMSVQRPAKLQE